MLKKRIQSFTYAFRGIARAVKEEPHPKIHLLAIAVVTIAGFYYSISATEWIACIICFGTVLSAEIMNSALEATVDKASPEQHPLAEKAKDMAAGAVLVVAIMSVAIATIIFIPKIFLS